MKISRLLLLCLLLFVAVTAIVAGIDMMVYPTGVLFRMHPLMLANSPFSNFFVPGTICLIAIGGSSLTAVLLLRENSLYALPAALLSGIIVIIWISCIVLMLKDISLLALLYWLAGFEIVVTTLYMQKKYDAVAYKTREHT